MRELRRLGWAAAVAAAVAAPGLAQQGGAGGVLPATSVTTSNGNVIGGSFGSGGGSTGTTGTGGGSGGSTTGDPSTQGAQLSLFEQAPQIGRPSVTQNTGTPNQAVNTSNFLRNYYGAPYYQGRAGIGTQHVNPGGFGTVLYTATGGAAGTTGGAGGRAGMAGGRGGAATNPSGVVVQVPVALAYPAQVRFAVAPVAPSQIQADLRGVIDRAPGSMLANPAGVQVQMADGNTVVLRGAVRDQDEARLVEGLVRLTPGVRGIKNELTFPQP